MCLWIWWRDFQPCEMQMHCITWNVKLCSTVSHLGFLHWKWTICLTWIMSEKLTMSLSSSCSNSRKVEWYDLGVVFNSLFKSQVKIHCGITLNCVCLCVCYITKRAFLTHTVPWGSSHFWSFLNTCVPFLAQWSLIENQFCHDVRSDDGSQFSV